MCVICDGGSEEELLSDEFVCIAINGFTMVSIEATPPWTYTIGLVRSFDHPELVMTGASMSMAADLITAVVERIRQGEQFDAGSPPLPLCGCTTIAFGAVHDAQWQQGRFNQWLNYYDWLGEELPVAQAVQVLWPDAEGRVPPDPDFCPHHTFDCQPLLDDAPRHDVNVGGNREQRRRRKYGHGKRKRG